MVVRDWVENWIGWDGIKGLGLEREERCADGDWMASCNWRCGKRKHVQGIEVEEMHTG